MIDPIKSNSELDLSYLREMSGDSSEFIIEMLDTLVEQIPMYLNDLQNAVEAKDWKATADFAHKVKPTFYYVGREDLRNYMQKIESDAKGIGNVEHVAPDLAAVQQEFKHVLNQVANAKSILLKTI